VAGGTLLGTPIPKRCPILSFLGDQILNLNGAASRPHFGSRFVPQKRLICVESGEDPANASFGAKDPKLEEKLRRILGVGIPNGGLRYPLSVLTGYTWEHKLAIARAKAKCDDRAHQEILRCSALHP
jgi:hypothetical protein